MLVDSDLSVRWYTLWKKVNLCDRLTASYMMCCGGTEHYSSYLLVYHIVGVVAQ